MGDIEQSHIYTNKQELVRQAAEIQSSKIVQPISDYLQAYNLDKDISFLYKEEIRDVIIYSPFFEANLLEKGDDLDKMLLLMEKYGLTVPNYIHSMHLAIKEQIERRKVVSQFENWLVGHMSYLDLEGLEIETIFYAAHTGFLIKFVGLDPIKDDANHQHSINNIKAFLSPEEWKKQSVGYQWVREQLDLGRSRKEIIKEFNLRHKSDPDNFSSREGRPLSAAILSHWAKETPVK